MNVQTFKTNLGDKEITVEVGKLAKQANCAVTVKCGETMVLVAATASRNPREGIDFFPLLVDVEQKMYSIGRIPGSFMRREGRASDSAILNSRLIDRGIRPLFPEGYRNDVQVTVTVLSSDQENQPDVLGILGAGIALTLSDIPFEGPFAGVRVGRVNGKFVLNPTYQDIDNSDIDLVVAGTGDAIMMVEAGMSEVPEAEVLDALEFAHNAVIKLVEFTEKMAKKVGKPKMEPTVNAVNADLKAYVHKAGAKKMEAAMANPDKLARQNAVADVKAALVEEVKGLGEKHPLTAVITAAPKDLGKAIDAVEEEIFRKLVTEKGIRIDGRKLDEIRAMHVEVDLVPRAHGSGLFQRGQTQALTVLTHGSSGDAQKIDTIDPETSRRYLHHYNFPGYSVGEVKPNRGPGRREIGHGALAERALKPVLPSHEDFPYAIRLVSEILESNGSSSMASVCGGSLALMDAGVPTKAPVAGIAMGLMKEGDDYVILSDILGDEDHLGDMDFKVTGTRRGICALQMDIKVDGLTRKILEEALEQAKRGRIHILEKMDAAISQARDEVSIYAPRIVTVQVKPDKVRDIIGPGGKTIRAIQEQTGAQIDINDSGVVSIASSDSKAIEQAQALIAGLTMEPEVGQFYNGIVKKIVEIGAFVEIMPGTDGLLHISEVAKERIRSVEDVLSEGDEVVVKCIKVDRDGKIRLSRREALDANPGPEEVHNFVI
jgi:polyribonucleotide nucleotidyltransferase